MKNLVVIFWIGLVLTACIPAKDSGRNDFPEISITLIPGDKVMVNTLPGNSILIFFGPDCDHCQRQAKDLQAQLERFRNHSLYFIASNPAEEITQFAETYGLMGHPNVFFARAEVEEVIRVLGPMNVPTIYIYSKEKQLVKRFDKETSVEEISKYL